MDSDSWLGLGLLLLCLVLLAFVSLAEAGLTSISRGWVKNLAEKGEKRAQAINRLLQQPSTLFSTFIITKSVAIVGFVALASVLATRLYGLYWGVVIATVAASFVVLVFFQVAAKALAAQNPQRAALLAVNSVAVLTRVLTPLIKIFTSGADLALRLLSGKRAIPRPQDEMEELRLLVDIGNQKGNLEEDEKEMIRGIFGLEETTAREIMVPRIDIIAVDTDSPISEVVDLIIKRGYSRIPIYEETIDNIVGIIYAKDLLAVLSNGNPLTPIKEIARPAHFIPEFKKIDELLREFQQKRVHIAIVVDEYGGTAGLVTIEDLLEEIVGEIEDEYDTGEPKIERISEGEAIMNAKISIDELNEMFGVSIEGEDFDTVGGFLSSQLGRIPSMGDEIEADGIKISVLSTVGRRVKEVRVTKSPRREEGEEEKK